MRLRDKKVRTFILLPIALIALATILTQLFLPYIKSSKNEGGAVALNANKDVLVLATIGTYTFDLESPTGLENPESIVEGKGTSGTHICKLNDKVEFGTTFSKKSDEIKNFKSLKEISFTFQVFAESATTDLVAVCSFETPKGEAIDWQGQDVLPVAGKWEKKTFTFPISEKVTQSQGKLKLYVWNKGHHAFRIDDMSVEFKGMVQAAMNNTAAITENYITWDFESAHAGLTDLSGITTAEHVSGTHSYHFTAERTFGPTLSKHVGEIAAAELKLITITAWIKPIDDDPDIYLVAEVKSQDGSSIYYEARNTRASKEGFPTGKWKKLRAQFKLPGDKITANDVVNVYIWNKTESEFYADDLEVNYGEQHARGGTEPVVNTSNIPATGYTFHQPDGPLPLKTMPKVALKNNDSNIPDGSTPVYAFYPQTAGKFVATEQQTDQLLVVSPAAVLLYAYCATQHGFHMLCAAPLSGIAGWMGVAQVCAGDFDKDGRDEAFIYNPVTASGKLIRFGAATTSTCGTITEKPSVTDVQVKTGDKIPSALSQVVAGDFNNDGKAEFIVADIGSTTVWIGSRSGDGQLTVQSIADVALLQDAKSANAFSLNTLPAGAGTSLLVSWQTAGHGACKSFRLNNNCSALQPTTTGLESLTASGAIRIMSGDFSPAYNAAALVIDRSWKFDARFVTGTGATGQLYHFDFAGFTPGKNPKYYEKLNLVSGAFVRPGQLSIVATMCNCNDASSTTKACKSVSNDAALPPSFQLYSF